MPGKHTKKEPINRGIGNYKGSGNFAMKNKVLMKSAKHGEPMQKNFLGKAMMGPGAMLLTKKPKSTKDYGTDVTNDPKYSKAKKAGKKVFKSNTGQITTLEGVPSKRKLKKMDKNIKNKQLNNIKNNLSKLSDEELMDMKANKEKALPKMSKIPTLPPKKLKTKASFYGQTGPSKPNKKMNRKYS